MKTCTKCGVMKALDCFARSSRAKDGRRPSCKHCASVVDAAWARANPEKIKARNAAAYAKNPGRFKASRAAWARANPEKIRAKKAAWARAYRKKLKQQAPIGTQTAQGST